MKRRVYGMLALAAVAAGATFLMVGPIPQAAEYHQFADARGWLEIPRAANVLSNVAFLIAGLFGLSACRRRSLPERPLYQLFFAGAALVCFGSAYYHLAPDNDRLVWDRLPMTLGFMSLLAAVIAERVDLAWGRRLLAPLLTLGLVSVGYWRWSEYAGAGDLRPYALVQFLSLALILYALLAFPGKYRDDGWFWAGLGWYVVAKLCEHFDGVIYAGTGELVGGHALKHVAAAVSVGWLAVMIARRKAGRSSGAAGAGPRGS